MIKISELKEGDVLKSGAVELTVLEVLNKCIIGTNSICEYVLSEQRLNASGYKLMTPPTPEKKYYMGFEVREYPERPIVEVSQGEDKEKYLRRLIEVKEDCVICASEGYKTTTEWLYIYRIPETRIIDSTSAKVGDLPNVSSPYPHDVMLFTSSGTREGDGC